MKTKKIEIIELDENGLNDLDAFAELIKKGETVVFPTETVYGLGANALDAEAVKKIFQAKGRPGDNPLIIHVAGIKDVEKLVKEIPEKAKLLMDAFWPGPLTLIMKKAECVPEVVSGGLQTIAVRYPDNPIAQEIIKKSGCPIAAPSANLSGKPSPTEAKHVLEDLDGRVAGMILSSDTELGLESTVIDMIAEPPVVLRPGDVTVDAISRIIGDVLVSKNVTKNIIPKKVLSPGMKYTHYSPEADLVVVKGNSKEISQKIKDQIEHFRDNPMLIGILASDETMGCYDQGITISLGSQNDPKEMARNLFSRLRTFDELGVKKIFAEDIETNNETLALINRLYKAAGYVFI
jgi:L-threonylcarbamoyladenylate synthase